MKRRFSLVLAVVLAVALVAVVPFATGAFDQETQIGDVEEGYKPAGTAINNADEFAKMEPNGTYYLARNIEITATYAADFTGKLDGNGKIITTTAPLFKNLKGEVKNLKITGTVNVSDYDAGALAQRASGATVTNVLNHANVTGAKKAITEIYNFTNVKDAEGATADSTRLAGTAGLVGSATGVCSFTDCMNLGAINGSPAGGIVGVMGYAPNDSSFTFVSCYNEGTISDNGCSNEGEPDPQGEDRGVAGIAGFAMDAKTIVFENCHNTGNIDASFADDGGSKAAKTVTGGIFGFVSLAVNTNSNSATLTVTGCTNNAVVKGSGQTGGIVGYNGKCDMTLKDCENKAEAEIISTASYTGGVAGRSDNTSTIENCNNYGSVFSAASGNMGGIVGYTGGSLTVKNCTNHASVDVSACGRPFGGILGSCEANATTLIDGCKNLGNIISRARTGGIAAELQNGTAKNCVNEGNVSSAADQNGGIVGRTYSDSIIENCVNNGNVSTTKADGDGKSATAGIVGYANTNIEVRNCVNNGDISAPKNAVGGIVGNVNKNVTVENCTNSGKVIGNNYVAGMLGDVRGTEVKIANCVNTESASILGNSYAGGIAGYAGDSGAGVYITITNCANHGDVTTENNYAGGIVGRANHAIYDSVNTGDILAKGNYAGGLAGYSGQSNAGKEIVVRCGNTGDVTANGDYASGMSAYVYGGTTAGTNEAIYMYCYTTGDIKATTYVTGVMAYINSGVVDTIAYNYIGGTLTATAEDGITAAIGYFNNKATTEVKAVLAHNYYVDGYAMYENYIPNQTSTELAPATTAEKVASGELAYTLNAAIKAADSTITEDVFYQTIGTDATPVLDNTHKAVLKLEDGSYANELPAPPVEPEDTTTEEETTTETPSEPEESTTATPSEPEESTTETPSEPEETTTATPFEPDGPIVGDSIATVIIVVAIAVVAIASTVAFVVIKKKEN